ncbi:GPW/gp25 family protein [Micromonospora sp. NPDC093277]|uniref:GPW/gp25 family protein n=1 Tax=Micromonospora sp. NPDC093277 TaxID=3364291 RepID=UPI00380F74CC
MSMPAGFGGPAGALSGLTGGPVTHVAFPLRLDGRGRTASADEEHYLRGLVEQVLFTRPGERVNRPDFGSGVDALVFAPGGDELANATQAMVHGALQRHLGDLIRVDQVDVRAHESTLEVTVAYVSLRAPIAEGRRILRVSGRPGSAGAGSP